MNFTLNIHSELWQNIQISRFQPNAVESWIIKCSFVLSFCKSGKKLFSFNFVSRLALYLFLLYKVHKKLWQTRHWLLWEQNCVANAENLMGFAFTCEWLCNIYLLHFSFNFLSLLSSFYFICHNWPTWVCKEYLPFYLLFVEKENCIMLNSVLFLNMTELS